MKKTLIICLLAAIFALYACSEDSDSGIDGDMELDAAEDETESDADVKQPVAHGREVLPERVPGECPRYPDPQELAEGAPEDADCYLGDSCRFEEEATCSKHSDCTEKDYGFCYGDSDSCSCHCKYHECMTDNECRDGEACLCLINDYYYAQAWCYKSCRNSAECENQGTCVQAGVGEYCGEIFFGGGVVIGEIGYRCTSADDECESDHDCPEDEYCVFDKGKDHFACVYYKYEGDVCD